MNAAKVKYKINTIKDVSGERFYINAFTDETPYWAMGSSGVYMERTVRNLIRSSHAAKHDLLQYPCRKCSERFESERDLFSHQASRHDY